MTAISDARQTRSEAPAASAPDYLTIPQGMTDDEWKEAVSLIEDWEATEDRMATDLAFALFRLFRKAK
jgi:hypothetical protein